MSLSLLKSFQTEELEVTRYCPGRWNQSNGRFEKGKQQTVFKIVASVQPLTPEEIEQSPEHRRNVEHLKLYTDVRLLTSEEKPVNAEKDLQPGDVIKHDGKLFEVQQVQNWHIGTDLPHYKVIAVKLDGE